MNFSTEAHDLIPHASVQSFAVTKVFHSFPLLLDKVSL